METNQFLRDFIKMRQELKAKEGTYATSTKRNATVQQPMPKPSGVTLATIIETKPSKAEVIKYLKQRMDNIVEEMSD